MPSTASSQPVAKHPPKAPDTVLAEAEAQWLFTEAELGQTPSNIDGMTPETERETRTKGLNFIMQVGIMLKLPQVTLSTASIFFNRFLMRHSLVSKPEQPKALHHYVRITKSQ
jgi:protein BUR2